MENNEPMDEPTDDNAEEYTQEDIEFFENEEMMAREWIRIEDKDLEDSEIIDDDDDNEETTEELTEQTEDKKKVNKGVDDGQYYREQPISMPRRPSGAFFQPQNQQNPKTDTNPSQLGSAYYDPVRDTYENKDMVHCPMCGYPTVTRLEAVNPDLEGDLRCTQCGARFISDEFLNAEAMEEIANALQANNHTEALGMANWMIPSHKSFNKKYDIDMTLKEYTSMEKKLYYTQAVRYAGSPKYRKLLRTMLSDLSGDQREHLIRVFKNSLDRGVKIKEITEEIEPIVKDKKRAELIARTEITRLANEGNILRMQDKGVKKLEYVSAPEDGRLCDECKRHDGKLYTIEQSKGMIPIHPRCRCLFTEHYD